MTKLLTTTLMLLTCTLVFGQKAKIKTDYVLYKYEIYPELDGYQEYKKFNIKISDKSGTVYSYSEGNTPQAQSSDINNMSGISYPFGMNTLKNDLFFEITQNSSTDVRNEFTSFQDQTTKVIKYAYRISALQNYTVKVYDNKNGNKLISEFTVEYRPATYWPGAPSATVGYGSERLLVDNFKHHEETEEGFYKKIDSRLVENTLVGKIGPDLRILLHGSQNKEQFAASTVHTKDTKFEKLDSAAIYVQQGMDEIKLNDKASIKGNHHVANAQNKFKKAHAIYLEFSKPEYVNWFTDAELKDEYIYGMKNNLFFTSFLVSDFAKANQIYEEVVKKIDEEKKLVKEKEAENNMTSVKAILFHSSAHKALNHMNLFRTNELREERLFTTFKQRYNY